VRGETGEVGLNWFCMVRLLTEDWVTDGMTGDVDN